MYDRLSLACLSSLFTESLFTVWVSLECFPSHSTVWASLPRVFFVSRSLIYTYICVFILVYIHVRASLSSVLFVSLTVSLVTVCVSLECLITVCVSLECLSSRSTAWASLSRVSFVSLNRESRIYIYIYVWMYLHIRTYTCVGVSLSKVFSVFLCR